jgi:hypothetical protein
MNVLDVSPHTSVGLCPKTQFCSNRFQELETTPREQLPRLRMDKT